jgi:hypothetical protein
MAFVMSYRRAAEFENAPGLEVEEALGQENEKKTRSFGDLPRSEFDSGTAALIETVIIFDPRSQFGLLPPSSAVSSLCCEKISQKGWH